MAARRREFVDDRDRSDENGHHRKNTHPEAQFLEWCAKLDREVQVDELGSLYQEWCEKRDTGQQAKITEKWR